MLNGHGPWAGSSRSTPLRLGDARRQCMHCPRSGVGACSSRMPLRATEVYRRQAIPRPGDRYRKSKTAWSLSLICEGYLRIRREGGRRPPSKILCSVLSCSGGKETRSPHLIQGFPRCEGCAVPQSPADRSRSHTGSPAPHCTRGGARRESRLAAVVPRRRARRPHTGMRGSARV